MCKKQDGAAAAGQRGNEVADGRLVRAWYGGNGYEEDRCQGASVSHCVHVRAWGALGDASGGGARQSSLMLRNSTHSLAVARRLVDDPNL